MTARPARPGWPMPNRYQLRMVGGQLCAIYTQPRAETVETMLSVLSSEEAADPSAAALPTLYSQPSRIERVTPTSRDWLGQLDVSEDLREQIAMVSWMYADENALYGTSYVDTAAFETGQRLLRWGLDGTLTVLPLPCPEYSTVLGIDGSCVLYMHESTPVDRLSLYESGNFVLFEQVGFAADKEFRVWDLATGQDRLVFTQPARRGRAPVRRHDAGHGAAGPHYRPRHGQRAHRILPPLPRPQRGRCMIMFRLRRPQHT